MKTWFSILLLAALLTAQLALVSSTPVSGAPAYSYQFLPSDSYAQSDARATLKVTAGLSSINPVGVDWVAPNGSLVSFCRAGGCGPTYDQSTYTNGSLNWRQFYFYISGNSRASGTYTAIVYHRVLIDGLYYIQELFRAAFTISGTPPPPPPPSGTPLGTLDTTFGTNGVVATTDFGSVWENTMTLQPDGKILVGVNSKLARYTPDGSLDADFGTGGKVTTTAHTIIAIALQKDNKIVVLDKDSFKVARYKADGSPDPDFTNSGVSLTGQSASGLLIQEDGKIVAVGYVYPSNGTDQNSLMVRYNADGSLDTDFGVNGIITSGTIPGDDETFYSAALQPDGKVVAAGGKYKDGFNSVFLVRYNTDGSPDSGFGSGGKVSAHLDSGNNNAYAVKVQPDGKIVVAGNTWPINVNSSDILLERFNSNGTVDTGFGNSGLTTTDFRTRDGAKDLLLQPDGMILIAGYTTNGGTANFVVARYSPAGLLDTSTGTIGYLMSAQSGEATALGVQADGKIVAAGNITAGVFELLRYIPATALPGPPNLSSPVNGHITMNPSVTLVWQSGPGGAPTSYEVQVDDQVMTTTSETLDVDLDVGTHTWKVRASNLGGTSDWSATWTVVVRVYYLNLPIVMNGS
jgi:uncharacterized delta-60 repeat protein